MIPKVLLAGVALSLVAAIGSMAETPAEKGERIARAAEDANDGFVDSTSNGEMTLYSKSGETSVRRFTSKTMEDTRDADGANLLVFHWPGDVRNTALLTHSHDALDDDQWLYLPAIGRVKRITSSGRSGAFLGSEFAYEDMVDQSAAEFDHLWIEDTTCPGADTTCHIIDRFPKSSSGYARQRVWIEADTYLTHQVHYFDRGEKHLKSLRIADHEKFPNGVYRAGFMRMENLLSGRSTDLVWSDHEFDLGLKDRDFSTQALKRLN
ncbi:MAG: outer membrane lipoprotein-sorting protein [Pseudomonadota bacterium]